MGRSTVRDRIVNAGVHLSRPPQRRRGSPVHHRDLELEHPAQKALAEWFDWRGLFWFHIPNGSERNRIVAAKLLAEGVKRGVPDNFIGTPPPKHPEARGVFLELKRTYGGEVSRDQERVLVQATENGYLCCVADGYDAAVKWLVEECGY